MKKGPLLSGTLAAATLCAGALIYLPAPYIWIGTGGGIVCLWLMTRCNHNQGKALMLNLAIVLFVFGGFEGWLYQQELQLPQRVDEIHDRDGNKVQRDQRHPVLGNSAVKNSSFFWKRRYGNNQAFDVVFTSDRNGLRITSANENTTGSDCILFFGGSFMFGAGVDDNNTLPYLVSEAAGKKFRSYNFAYSGYGPHQMLAALEQGVVSETIDCQPRYAIYWGIVDHARRVSGKADWVKAGPRYVSGKDGQVTLAGHFEDSADNELLWYLDSALRKSLFANRLMSDIRNSDIELMAAIIGKSASLFRQHYPGGEFHVIFQDEPDSWRSDAIIDQLEARNIQAHRVSAILPDYFARQADYLIEHDGHPNRLTHRLLADYVGKRVIRQDNRLESTSRKILTVR